MCVRICECNHCNKRETCSDCAYIPDKVNCVNTGVSGCKNRVLYPNNRSEPTNADRFRRMTDEELAVTLMCPNEMGMAEIPCDHSDDKSCCQCLLDWLRQPMGGSEQ